MRGLLLVVVAAAVVVLATTMSVSATYINGVGFNLERNTIVLPQAPHQVQYPPVDTSVVAARGVKEAAIACDPIAPVQRVVTCEIHTFDECGNPYGYDFNLTQGWTIDIQNLDHPAAEPTRLVSPIVWIQKGVGRFYFTPLTIGIYRVRIGRIAYPYVKDLQYNRSLGINAGGFTVKVHGVVAKGTTANFGETNVALQQMLWATAKANAEPAQYPPAMPPTNTFEDKKHEFDDRKFAMLQEAIRRTPIKPGFIPPMPDRTARVDDNAHRLVDIVFP